MISVIQIFLHTLGLAQFTVQPESVVQAEGLEAVFECLHPGAFTYSWGIDGIYFADSKFPPDLNRILPSGGSPARLIIPGIPQYNNTVVQCKAFISITYTVLLSQNATLFVQGECSDAAFYIEHSLMHKLLKRSFGFCHESNFRF